MKEAIRQAKKAEALEEVPIGCVIVHEGKIIARGYNRRNTDKNTLSHAELNAIRKASKKLGDWRLEECTMYVTLEPCQMCSGALVQSRIDEVVIGCMNAKAGCAGSVMNLLQVDGFNHQVKITQGILEEECSSMLSEFFKKLREKKKQEKAAQAEKEANKAAALAADDSVLLAALIQCEAGEEPYEGQVAVGAVVMNRVRSGAYPNTVKGVIYASGQFTPAGSGQVGRVVASGKIKASCLQAAQEAMAGSTPVGTATHFRRAGSREGIVIGHHVFW